MELTLPAWRGTAGRHRPHPLHEDPATEWDEANCYIDLWIELLHGLGLDPYPVLACALGLDFEGDQWTFFKPDAEDLRRLYGIEIAELTVYRPLSEHCATQIGMGRPVVTECDAYGLPDATVSYRRAHAKTTIAVVSIDPAAARARYLHNSGCYPLEGEDFEHVLADGGGNGWRPAPYAETVKLAGLRHHGAAELRALSVGLAARHLTATARVDAADRFADRLAADIQALFGGPDHYDGYAFATLRQLGAAAAFSAQFLRWLDDGAGLDLKEAIDGFDALSSAAKTLVMKTARAVRARRRLEAEEVLVRISEQWRRAHAAMLVITDAAGVGRVAS